MTIKEMLADYKKYENEAIEELKEDCATYESGVFLKDVEMHKQNIKNIEGITKHLKALDIIKTNRVDVGVFYAADNVNEYNSIMYELIERNYGKYLTQEEFDLLKEMMNNGKRI